MLIQVAVVFDLMLIQKVKSLLLFATFFTVRIPIIFTTTTTKWISNSITTNSTYTATTTTLLPD